MIEMYIMQNMERIFELNLGEIDKASGKPIIHELHIDLESFRPRASILSLVFSSMFKHEGWKDDSLDTSDRKS